MRGRWAVVLMLGIVSMAPFLFAEECGEGNNEVPKLNRSFKLTILDSQQAPNAGVKVSLGTVDRYNAMHPVSAGVTDQKGVLNFVNVKTGNLTLQLVDTTGERRFRDVQIVPTGGDAALKYRWPYVHWLSLRSPSGYLMNYDEPMRHWNVTLESFPDAAELAYADSDIAGKFDLPTGRAGRYYLELSKADRTGTKKSLGRIAFNATLDDHYPVADAIFVEPTSCGIVYDQYCTRPARSLTASCIQTVDAKGNGIATASAMLIPVSGAKASTKFTTDKDGYIKLPNFAGDFELRIFAKGFTPVRQLLTLSPGDSTCNTAIVIPMYTFGSSCVASPQGKGN